jgi:hypothetical protein
MIVYNLSITLGNGSNGSLATPNIMAASVGGTVDYTSGNKPNFVQLGDNTVDGNNESYTVQMVFGSANDYLAVDIGTGVLTGSANGGGGTNTFNLISGTLAGTFVKKNF